MATQSRRKSWDQLSPAYRKRLERAGVTKEAHAAGAGLHKARGHGSKQKESFTRRRAKWMEKMATATSRDVDDIEEEMNHLSLVEQDKLMRHQEKAEELYRMHRLTEASDAFQDYLNDLGLPWWMIAYRGLTI